jgi:nucleobase:cation symporter-1, NCS1 family
MLVVLGRCLFSAFNLSSDTDNYQIYTFAWIYGFFMSLSSYYIICTYISPITAALVEEAVYPPQKEDVVSPDGSDYYETKDHVVTKSKEVSPV